MFIDKLHIEDIDEVSLLIAESFVTHEPLTKHVGITLPLFQQWCTQVVKSSIKDNMCFVTKNQDNVITGCIIAENTGNTIWPDCCQLRPIWNLLDDVAEKYPQSIIKSKTLHLYIAATKLGYEGQGICYKLTQHLIDKAKKSNYNYVVSELTSKGTQHICINKLEFENIYCCQYTDYQDFENLPGECILAIRSL
jgi:predicted GNAT family acetyltransferase